MRCGGPRCAVPDHQPEASGQELNRSLRAENRGALRPPWLPSAQRSMSASTRLPAAPSPFSVKAQSLPRSSVPESSCSCPTSWMPLSKALQFPEARPLGGEESLSR